MSVRVMTAVWAIELPDSEKLVLLALADCANDEGHCWPSMKTLVAKCSKSDRTIQHSIQKLCDSGHLTRREVMGKGCNYTVHPRKDFAPERTSPRSDIGTPPKGLRETPEAASDKPSKNHQEPPEDCSSGDEPALSVEEVFEGFQSLMRDLGLPVPRDLTPSRRQLIGFRIKQYPLEDFQTVFAKCRDSPFLRGDRGRTPLKFDWLFERKNFQKVLEGNYD